VGCQRNQTVVCEGGRGEVDLGSVIVIEKICTSMWVYYHVREDRGWAPRRVGGGEAGGGNSKRVESGRNRRKLCNNAA